MPQLASSVFIVDRDPPGWMFTSGLYCDGTTPGPCGRNQFINLLTAEKQGFIPMPEI